MHSQKWQHSTLSLAHFLRLGNIMEIFLLELLKEYGYIVLFFWTIIEGETGLITAGIMAHTGDMLLPMAITIGALGGFAGDQIYFYIGRTNKKSLHKKLISHRRKFAIAHLLIKKYGWPVIFVQRYMIGLRAIIPIAIGLTKYSARSFAFINFISAFLWSAVTVLPAYYFGHEILQFLQIIKNHWFLAIPIIGGVIWGVMYIMKRSEEHALKKRQSKRLLRAQSRKINS